MKFLAILIGKLTSFIVKNFKIGGGSSAPGLVALKICPEIITDLASEIPKNIIITGTNGKTTTAKLLAHFAKTQGLKVVHNQTGSNLERGITSTLISNYNLRPTNYNLGIWELDEAAFNTVAPKLKPDVIVFLNAFRDQLDRYGEVDAVVRNWQKTLENLPQKIIILINGDDTNTKKLAGKSPILRFGLEKNKISGEGAANHKNLALDIQAIDVILNGLENSNFLLKIENLSADRQDLKLKITLPLPGIYNIYNFLAAFGIGLRLGFEPKKMLDSLSSFTPAFGRAEKFDKGIIYLIKNPVGATQVLQTLTPNLTPADTLLIALNDQIADGTDVSWIWDVDFEKLKTVNCKLKTVVSGTRAYDMALRLKYSGIDPKQLIVVPELKKAFAEAQTGLSGCLFILPTYTAMLELQKILTKSGLKKNYWEES